MDIILVPGLWLDASSWERVVPPLEAAGHRTNPLTLPGMDSADADASGIGLRDHVDAVVRAIDAGADPVLLVGHSAGCGIAWAAIDARPDRVTRAVLVGGFPTGDGSSIASGFAAVDGRVPMPELKDFDDADLVDLDEEARIDFRARAIPVPERVTTDAQSMSDDRRYDVPMTAVCTEYRSTDLREWVDGGMEPVRELSKVRDLEYVDLPTGHWPQFTKPDELATIIADRAG